MNKYCNQCGSPSPKLANFCGSCGSPFTSGLAKTQASKPIARLETDDEDDETAEIPGNLGGLDVEIQTTKYQGISCANVINEAINNPIPNKIDRPKNKKLSKKAALEQFRKEAGNSRESINVGGER